MQAGMGKAFHSGIGVIGAGAWGTAIAKILAEKGSAVGIWCYEKELAEEINTRSTSAFLPGIALPPSIRASTDLAEVVSGKGRLLLAVPSLHLLGVVDRILSCPEIHDGRLPIAVLTKGLIDTGDGVRLITEAIEERLPGAYKGKLAYISGPSHAMEVASGKITGLISASRSGKNAIMFRELLSGGNLVVFSSLDVRGVQVSAALKNVIAIAFGMLDALKESSDQFGDNTESLLLATGLSEIQLVGRRMGATHPETFASIAGVGDLDVTCRSVWGRNRRFGRELIANLPSFGYTPEGVVTARHVHTLSVQKGLSLPISGGVYRILNREADPLSEVANIVERITGGSKAASRNLWRFGRISRFGRAHRLEGK
jgi:glycerol-3-phosphate dehydrogenase (NAD(P)+)